MRIICFFSRKTIIIIGIETAQKYIPVLLILNGLITCYFSLETIKILDTKSVGYCPSILSMLIIYPFI